MSTTQAQDTWMVLEDALYQLVYAATQNGGALAVQPNPDGSTGVGLVERIAPPEQNVFPCVGVQFTNYDESVEGANKHLVVANFDIVIATKRNQSDAVADTGSAALQDLRNYINDGQGNGLSPLLRANVTLFGLCTWSGITRMERFVLQSDASSASTIATAIYTYQTKSLVRTWG